MTLFIETNHFHGQIQNLHANEMEALRAEAEAMNRDLERQMKEMENELKTVELRAKFNEMESEAVQLVESVDVNCKNAVIEESRQMLSKLKSTKAHDEGSFSSLLAWSGTYLADNYPMAPTAIVFYVSAINWADSYFSGSECDLIYQIVRYLFLFLSLGYLTLIGYRTSSAANFLEFLGTFWVNWVVFTLMVMALMALPPMSCYGHTVGVVMNLLGILGLLGMALTLNAVNRRRSRFVHALSLRMCLHSDFVALLSQ